MSKQFDWSKYENQSPQQENQFDWNKYEAQVQEEPSTLQNLGTGALEMAEALPVGVSQGISGGFAEEAGSAVGAASDWIRRKLGIELEQEAVDRKLKEQGFTGDLQTMEDKDILSQYQQMRDVSREKLKDVREKAPVTSFIGELAGGMVAPGSAVGLIGKGANLATKVGIGAATGAGMGGVYGLGTTEADLTKGEVGKALEEVGQGAALGGALGGAVPLAGAAVGKVGKTVGNLWEDLKNRNIAVQDISDIYNLMKNEGKQFLGMKQLKEQNTKLLPEVVGEIGDTVKQISNEKGGDIKKIYDSIQGKINTVDDLQNSISKIRKEASSAINEKEKKELVDFADFLESKLPTENKVVKSGIDISTEEANLARQKLLRDFQAKKKLLEEQNLPQVAEQKALDKLSQKIEQKSADQTRQAEILGEATVPNYAKPTVEGQRVISPEFTTGKTLSTPIKEVKQPTLELTPTEVELDLNRVLFRNKQTGDVAFEKPLAQDVTENVVKQEPLEAGFVNELRKDIGKKAYETTNLEQAVKKQASDVYTMLKGKLQAEVKDIDPAQLNKLQELNADFSNLSNAVKLFQPELKTMDKAVQEEVKLALSNLVSNINDPRNLSATRIWGNFIEKMKTISPEKATQLEGKITNIAKKIDLNMKYLGIDPSMSTDPTRVLAGPAMKWGFRGAEILGKKAYQANLAPNAIAKLSKMDADGLLARAQQIRQSNVVGKEAAANFYENLAKVENNQKKSALLFTATLNPNISPFLDVDEEENP